EPVLAMLTTTSSSGEAHNSYVWCDSCGLEVYLKPTVMDAQRHDLEHNCQATVRVTDPKDVQRYVEIRGDFTLMSVADPMDCLHCDTPRYYSHVCPEDMHPLRQRFLGKITPTHVETDRVLDN
ncbi:MAG: pyridoxamine 5'-phosphate oxidase family protein, partial [Acidimicrobiales bacterium]